MGLRQSSTAAPLAWVYAAIRTATPGGAWGLSGFGYCASCDRRSMFVLAKRHAAWVRSISAEWDHDEKYKRALAIREANICALCGANQRMRAQARAVLDMLGFSNTSELIARLTRVRDFLVFEAATHTVFRTPRLVRLPNYFSSEYREGAPLGTIVDGILNEDLHSLSFPDSSIDVVLTSDVLEHVQDLDRALHEIGRVLKVGGIHVLTVPSDPALPQTIERARVIDGEIVHELPPVYHGDSMRDDGILAYRDFGADAAQRISKPDMPCRAIAIRMPDGSDVTVYVAKKRR